MKLKIAAVLTGLAVCAPAFGATFTNPPTAAINYFGTGTTNGATTASYAVVSARSANGGAPVVTFINAGTDLATATLKFYKVTAFLNVPLATNASTILYVDNTNNSAANWQSGTILIRHKTDDTYEKRTLAANTGATNIVVTVVPLGPMVVGDTIYCVTSTGQPAITWGAITNSLGGSGALIYAGQKGMPLLMDINATTAGTVQAVGGFYSN